MKPTSPRTIRLAITGRWIEHLFDVEARAAYRLEREAERYDNGPDESARLHRLRRAWRARTLVWLGIRAESPGDLHLNRTAKRLWMRDAE